MIIILLPDETIPPVILSVREAVPGGYQPILVYTSEALDIVRTIVATHGPHPLDGLSHGALGMNAGDAIWSMIPTSMVSREQLALHLAVPADRLDGRAIALISEQHFPIVKDKIPDVEIIEQLVCGSA